jgi:hypothetical protein
LTSPPATFDRRFLAAGEVAGDGEGTDVHLMTSRIYWCYYFTV